MDNISDIVWANKADTSSSIASRIKNYGYELLSQKNIDCEYFIDEQVEKKLTSPEARKNILLIVKEALNNMAKYSEASEAEVHVALKNAHLQIDISDNGVGFDMNQATERGNGLAHLEQRTASMRGFFNLTSSPGRGTSIRCEIPLAKISDGTGNKL